MLLHHRRHPRRHWHWHIANAAVILNLTISATLLVIAVVEHLDKVKP